MTARIKLTRKTKALMGHTTKAADYATAVEGFKAKYREFGNISMAFDSAVTDLQYALNTLNSSMGPHHDDKPITVRGDIEPLLNMVEHLEDTVKEFRQGNTALFRKLN